MGESKYQFSVRNGYWNIVLYGCFVACCISSVWPCTLGECGWIVQVITIQGNTVVISQEEHLTALVTLLH